ncbi:hypothetical protein ACWGDS_48290 [Streptomyces sp. NPDC055059]
MDISRAGGPAVIVSASGMATGGMTLSCMSWTMRSRSLSSAIRSAPRSRSASSVATAVCPAKPTGGLRVHQHDRCLVPPQATFALL